jgi:hypothetical protein
MHKHSPGTLGPLIAAIEINPDIAIVGCYRFGNFLPEWIKEFTDTELLIPLYRSLPDPPA